jgi:hypothetical protein
MSKPQAETTNSILESRAIQYSGVMAGLAGLLMFGAVKVSPPGISEMPTFGFILAASVAVVAFIVFVFAFNYFRSTNKRTPTFFLKVRMVVATIALAFAHAAIGFLMVIAMVTVLVHETPGLVVGPITMIGITAALAGVTTYIVYIQSVRMEVDSLAGLLMVFIVSGSIASMVTAGDTNWWQHHLSALGAGETLSSYTFNLTMVVGGVIVALLADMIADMFSSIQKVSKHEQVIRSNIVRLAFFIAGLGMIGVGFVTIAENRVVHDISANMMSVSMGVVVVLLPWLVPIISRTFTVFSYLMLITVVVAYSLSLHYGLGVLAFELVAGAALFAWMILFVRQIRAIYHDKVKPE